MNWEEALEVDDVDNRDRLALMEDEADETLEVATDNIDEKSEKRD
jgi:hypothetical protein